MKTVSGLSVALFAVLSVTACASEPAHSAEAGLEATDAMMVRFETQADTLWVTNHATDEKILTLLPDDGAFLKGLVPALQQDRKVKRLDLALPYVLTRHDEGGPVLQDTESDLIIDIQAFGVDAVKVFESLMEAYTDSESVS